MEKKKLNIFFGVIMCLCLTWFYGVICSQKVDFLTDEWYTYQLANSQWGPWFYFPEKEWFSSDLIRQQLVVQEGDTFNYAGVIERESHDLHPFLYTALIHTLCSFCPGKFSQWIGLSVNIVFAVLGVLMIFLCMKRLLDNNVIAIGTAVFYGVSYGLIQEVTFIRAYVIVMFLVALTLYVHLKFWDDSFHLKFYIPLGVVSLCGALIHYYYIVVLVGCCIVFFLRLLGQKKVKEAAAYFATEAIAGLTAILIFPRMISAIFGNSVTSDTGMLQYFDKFKTFLGMINKELFGGLLWIWLLLIIFLIAYSFYRKKKGYKDTTSGRLNIGKIIFLGFPCVMCILVVSKSAELITSRYVAGVYPAVVLLWSYVLYHALEGVIKKEQIMYLVMAAVCLISLGKSYWHNEIAALCGAREEVLLQTERREGRNAILLNLNGCVWTMPSAYSELKDYNSLLVYPYTDVDSGELEHVLAEYDKDAINVYCYNWDMSETDYNEYCDKVWAFFKGISSDVKIEKLWNSYYCEVYEISGLK